MTVADRTTVPIARSELRRRIDALPRIKLTDLPTPLDELHNLRREVGGPRLFMKRDDLTQHAFGGNKNRKFQFEIADAVEQGADVIVWAGGAGQSNHARQCAAAARRAGLDVVLLLNRGPHADNPQGNRLLLDLMGAEVRSTGREELFGTENELDEIADELRAQGRRPYLIRYGPLTAVGYAECLIEIAEQAAAVGASPTRVYLASSGGTQAGLELANHALQLDLDIRGFTPTRFEGDRRVELARIANLASDRLALDLELAPDDFWNSDAMVGEGYALPDDETIEAIRLVARTEGIFLDPVYSAKAFAGLLRDVRDADLTDDDTVVFVHTGGTPLLFTYLEELAPAL